MVSLKKIGIMEELYSKGVAIIESCNHPNQLQTAKNWVSQVRGMGYIVIADKLTDCIYEKSTKQIVL